MKKDPQALDYVHNTLICVVLINMTANIEFIFNKDSNSLVSVWYNTIPLLETREKHGLTSITVLQRLVLFRHFEEHLLQGGVHHPEAS